MKQPGLFVLVLMSATSLYAQKGVEDGSRFGHGQDSIKTRENISIYVEYYKTGDFKEAYDNGWKTVFDEAPLASVNTYTYGIRILRSLYNDAKTARNEELMAKFSSELFQVYEQRLKYLDQLNEFAQNKVTDYEIMGQYGHDYMSYNPKVQISKAYEILRMAVDLGKGQTQDYVLDDLMNVSAQRFKNKKDNEEYREALMQDYVDCANYIDQFIDLQTDEKAVERAQKYKDRIDGLFINSGAADCDKLEEIYGPKIENNKDDLEYLNKVVKLMSRFDCKSSNVYFTAAEYAYRLSPSVQNAKNMGYLYLNLRNDSDKALEFYNQAIELDDDKTSMADTYYKSAYIYMAKENYDRCRTMLQKCISNNPGKGDAYILMAKLYDVKHDWSSDPALNRCAYFAVLDKLEQARKVDPSIADKANELILQYKKQTPQIEDLFMLGYKAGDKIEIKGWINETTTIR